MAPGSEEDDALDGRSEPDLRLPVSTRIQEAIRASPGIHFRALGRAAALNSTGQLRHHLDRLARRGVVSEVADGRYRRYFPASQSSDLQPQLARLSRPLPRRIVRLLSQAPMGRTAMRRQLSCADSTLGYHLQRMLAQGDLQQRRDHRGTVYVLADPERVRRILRVQDGLPDDPPMRPATASVVPVMAGFSGFAGNPSPEPLSLARAGILPGNALATPLGAPACTAACTCTNPQAPHAPARDAAGAFAAPPLGHVARPACADDAAAQ